jgi:hypothetical protein
MRQRFVFSTSVALLGAGVALAAALLIGRNPLAGLTLGLAGLAVILWAGWYVKERP